MRSPRWMPPLALIGLLALAGMAAGMGGCARPVPAAPPSCQEVLAGGLARVSDNRVAQLLEESSPDEEAGCWRSLVAACLRRNRALPVRQLARAVEAFNRQADVELFHLATRAYLTALATGDGRYRPQDRALLEAYTRLLIRQAHSSADRNLRAAQLLCQRLDSELYRRFFQNPEADGNVVSY